MADVLSTAAFVRRHAGRLAAAIALAAACGSAARGRRAGEGPERFVDLSLLVAPEYPCTWPTFPPFQINHYRRSARSARTTATS